MVGRKSEPSMVDFGGVLVNDECVDWGLDDLVPIDEIDAFDAMQNKGAMVNPRMKSTSLIAGLIALDREIHIEDRKSVV